MGYGGSQRSEGGGKQGHRIQRPPPSHTTPPFYGSFHASPQQLWQLLQEAQQTQEGFSHFQSLAVERRKGGRGSPLISNVL